MSDQLTFRWIEIENFRGFRDRQRIDVDASAVVLSGHNGTGKTSFFDAIQWLLVGSLQRLEPWRTRRNTEHVANVFSDDPAIVTAGIRIGDQIAEIRRQGRHDSGYFEWSNSAGLFRGDAAERLLLRTFSATLSDVDGLRRTLMRSGLLQQDVVRVVLEEKGFERYEHIAGILGLDAVAEFERAARRRADQAAAFGRAAREALQVAERRRDALTGRITEARARSATSETPAGTVRTASDGISQFAPVIRLTRDLPTNAEDAVKLAGGLADVSSVLGGVAERLRALATRARDIRAVAESELAAARQRTEQANADSEHAASQLMQVEDAWREAIAAADAATALAATALPLLSDVCPVCSQPINEGQIREHLSEIVTRSGAVVDELQVQVEAGRNAAQEARGSALAASAEERRLTAQAADFNAYDAQRRAQFEHARSEVHESLRQLSALGLEAGDQGAIERLDAAALMSIRSALTGAAAVTTELAAALRAAPLPSSIASLEAQLPAATIDVSGAQGRARDASVREERTRTLQRAAARASTAVAERRFRLLAPLVGDIYARLDPHPVFKALDFALGVYRERGVADPVVRDVEMGVEADPLLVFSAAQANVAALAYFLAFGWASGRQAMPFVLLDDPLQSLDDVNALGFADLCRHVRRQRQLMLSTHDRRLAALLERKLAPRAESEHTIVLEFGPWSRHGPEITLRTVEPQLDEGLHRRLVVAA